MNRICTCCGEEKPLTEYHRRGDGHKAKCAVCCRAHHNARYASDPGFKEDAKRRAAKMRRDHPELKEKFNQQCNENKMDLVIEHGGSCRVCGFDKYMGSLSFHHLDPGTKKFEVSGKNLHNLKRARKEASKCMLLCLNCHLAFHHGELELPAPERQD